MTRACHINKGKNNMKTNNFVCAICGKSFKTIASLSKHIKIHNISKEEYYKKYILKSDNIICPYCKQHSLKFHDISNGYYN